LVKKGTSITYFEKNVLQCEVSALKRELSTVKELVIKLYEAVTILS
jgi:hypothetical protein